MPNENENENEVEDKRALASSPPIDCGSAVHPHWKDDVPWCNFDCPSMKTNDCGILNYYNPDTPLKPCLAAVAGMSRRIISFKEVAVEHKTILDLAESMVAVWKNSEPTTSVEKIRLAMAKALSAFNMWLSPKSG